MKKLPPYGRPLADLIKKGFRPNNDINLFIGNKAWQKGNSFSITCPTRTLVLPPWLSPFDYHWPVKQCGILLFDTGYADKTYLEDLIYCLFKNEAASIYLVFPQFSSIFYKKDV